MTVTSKIRSCNEDVNSQNHILLTDNYELLTRCLNWFIDDVDR